MVNGKTHEFDWAVFVTNYQRVSPNRPSKSWNVFQTIGRICASARSQAVEAIIMKVQDLK